MALSIGLILLIEIILFFTNYLPHTFLIGWDNLTPEFNISANLSRELFGVWASYRGPGLVNGMAEIANLFHTLYITFLSMLFNISDLRYILIFFLHLSGGLGIFMLIKMLTGNLRASFIGALFYMFNIGVIQMFFAPLETFAFHFAALPIGALFIIKALENTERKNLFFLFLTSLFFSPQSFVPTFFIVYIILVGAIFLFHQTSEKDYKKIFIIIMVIIMSNAFWGLPYIYTSLTNANVVVNSKINQMSTEDDLLKNKAYGNLKSVALIQGFLLDYTDSQPKGNNDFIMPAWKEHVDKPPFVIFGFLLFILAAAGGVLAIRRKNRKFYPFVLLFIISFLMLGSDIPVLNLFSKLLSFIPYFSQVFRFTFTKFSMLYAFSFSILLAYTLSWIFERERFRYSSFILPLAFLAIIFYLSYPAFRGQFVYQNLRVKIPQDYFKLTDYFKNQQNGRIATLPQPSYWGWTYTNWGYRGSGFIWYGIPQPTLDGAFLPWSRENENYYWEISYAINSSNQKYFESVLNKYQISWVVLDHSVISQYSSKATSIETLENLIKGSQEISFIKKFGAIDVYKVKQASSQKNFISLDSNLPNINSYRWNNFDTAYLENTDYETINNNNEQIYYPLRSIFTGRAQKDLELGISDKGHYFSLTTTIPTNLAGGSLVLPKIYKEEVSETNENLNQVLKYPQILLDKELILTNIEESENSSALFNSNGSEITLPYIRKGDLEIRVPKFEGYYSYQSQDADLLNRTFKNCNPFVKGKIEQKLISVDDKKALRLTSINSDDCFNFDLSSFSQRLGFLVKIRSRNLEGKSLLFAVINKNSQRPDLETKLPKSREFTDSYYIIPPMEDFGAGYNLYFDNASIGNDKTVNDLYSIEIHPIPYRFLTFIKVVKQSGVGLPLKAANGFSVFNPNPSLYEIKLNKTIEPDTTLVLSQSYNPGWKAYEVKNSGLLTSAFPFIFSNELKNPVVVNNWENGFILPANTGTSTIYIVYLPQYLEYLGFLILLIVPIYLLRLKK